MYLIIHQISAAVLAEIVLNTHPWIEKPPFRMADSHLPNECCFAIYAQNSFESLQPMAKAVSFQILRDPHIAGSTRRNVMPTAS